MTVIAGHDPLDPTSARSRCRITRPAWTETSMGCGSACPRTYFLDECRRAVVAGLEAAVAVLAARGATIVRLTLPLMDAVSAYVAVIVARVEGATIHGHWMRERLAGLRDASSAPACSPASPSPAPTTSKRSAAEDRSCKAFAAEVFGQVDVLAAPTIQDVPADAGRDRHRRGTARDGARRRWAFRPTPGHSTTSACRR